MNLMMNKIVNNAMMKIESDPRFLNDIQNNPAKNAMYQALKSGDSTKGRELAQNICRSSGMTENQAVDAAANYFGRFGLRR